MFQYYIHRIDQNIKPIKLYFNTKEFTPESLNTITFDGWTDVVVNYDDSNFPKEAIRKIEIRIKKPFSDNKNRLLFIFIDNIHGKLTNLIKLISLFYFNFSTL